jgi:dihydrofolate reductase
MIAIIVARSRNRVIGKDGDMPWGRQLKGDLQRFKRLTIGHTVVMGRKTYESIGKALPDRTNIVLSRDPSFMANGCVVKRSLKEALACADVVFGPIFVIGGGSVYLEALLLADTVYETVVEVELEGDTFFPELDPAIWEVANEEEGPTDESMATRYVTHWRR